MLVNPLNMLREARVLVEKGIVDALERIAISEHSLIITPYQVALNRLQATNSGAHTTCGQGVGQAREDHALFKDAAVFASDLSHRGRLREKLEFNRWCCAVRGSFKHPIFEDEEILNHTLKNYEQLASKVWVVDDVDLLRYAATDHVIFEGAQGVLLDETYGEDSYNTWTNCTFENAQQLLDDAGFTGTRHRLGVLRTYHTRHGDGPLSSENVSLDYPELHNNSNDQYQGKFRRGTFDCDLVQQALKIIDGVDSVALNHLDHCEPVADLEAVLQAPISIRSYGPTRNNRVANLALYDMKAVV
jgi:adenylosuccinate synthase